MSASIVFFGQHKCSKQKGLLNPCGKYRSRICPAFLEPVPPKRRFLILFTGTTLIPTSSNWSLAPIPVKAEEDDSESRVSYEDGGDALSSIKSLFDPNETTKSGKILPKAYLNSAREVVRTLKASLVEDPKDVAKFRRTADAAKESIKEYLKYWRGQSIVAAEESYVALEKAIRSLASFYSRSGPFAKLTEEVKSDILNDLKTAEAFL